ncbi:MAG: hypothetical protein FT726_24715 [Pantoea sp. Morm]|uniref:ApeA N-terminal domain 1-containing protein n=1 Tax=Pantoea sp. Morm TaxID=2601250 RepID=UPI001D607565|nr:hypothetical protein [Pantoea sp. Morm]
MRIKEEVVREGEFWIADNINEVVRGRLYIRENQTILLELDGALNVASFFSGNTVLKRINGKVEKEGEVTLEGCLYKKINITGGIGEKSLIHVNCAFLGHAFKQDEEIKLDSLSFSVDHLEEWVGVTGISFDHKPNEKDVYAINYSRPKDIVISLDDGYELKVTFGYAFKGTSSLKETKVEHMTNLVIEGDKPIPYEELSKIAHDVVKFISLAFEKPLVIARVRGRKKVQTEGVSQSTDFISIYYKSNRYNADRNDLEVNDMIFEYKDIANNASDHFKKWMKACKELSPSISLYFSSAAGQHGVIEARFISLVQGLETYHRANSHDKKMPQETFEDLVIQLINNCPDDHKEWLRGRLSHGNEINLMARMKSVTSCLEGILGDKKMLKSLSREVVNTRNYLTHYNPDLKEKAASGKRLVQLNYLLELVFLAHFLKIIGFDDEKIKMFYERNFRLKQLIRFIKTKN